MDQDPRDEEDRALVQQPARNQIARQDFGGQSLEQQNGATAALAAKAKATVEARIIAAKRWPRNMLEVRDRILADCARPDFAQVAMYARPVGKKFDEATGQWVNVVAEGLSIRFAEAAARAMGNIAVTSETIYEDESIRLVRVEAVDNESNVPWTVDLTIHKTVERKKLKKGQRPLGERENSYGDHVFIVQATDEEVAVKAAAAVSKASRTCILRVVPGEIQDEAKRRIKAKLADRDAKDPAEQRNKMLDAFASVGVRPAALEQYLGHALDSMSPAELGELRGVFQAIRDGETSWAEALAVATSEREDSKAKPAPTAGNGSQRAEPPKQPSADPTQAPAAPTPPRDDPKAKSSGKGTAALKLALAPNPPAMDERAYRRNPDLPPGTSPAEPGNEYRYCAGCSDIIEVPVATLAGALCEVCRQV